MTADRLEPIASFLPQDRLQHFLKNKIQAYSGGSYLVELGIKSQNWDLTQKGWQMVQRNQRQINRCTTCLLMQSMIVEELTPCSLAEAVSASISMVDLQPNGDAPKIEVQNIPNQISVLSDFMLLKYVLTSLVELLCHFCEAAESSHIKIQADQAAETITLSLSCVGVHLDIQGRCENLEKAPEFIEWLDWQTAKKSIEKLGAACSVKKSELPNQTHVLLTLPIAPQ